MGKKRIGWILPALLITMVWFTIFQSANPAATGMRNDRGWEYYERELQRLEYYRLRYPREIVEFCIHLNGVMSARTRRCLKHQEKQKIGILQEAHDQLGRRSQAHSVYRGCLNYYPVSGVARVGACVRTRLMLRKKLADESIETRIYQKCDSKWRKHGFRAVHSCCIHEGSYYEDYGQLRD